MNFKLEIGKIYRFNYQRTTPKHWKESDRLLCTLGYKEKEKVISNLIAFKEKIKNDFIDRYYATSDLRKLMRKLDKLESNRKPRERKSPEYIQLENTIEEIKKQLFPKRKYTAEQKAVRSFYRYFDNNNLRFEETGFMEAVYVGPTITRTGQQIDKWIVLSPIKIPKEQFNEKYMIKVRITK
jgi:hypothetical protein